MGLRSAFRPLPPPGLSLRRQPRAPPERRGGPDAARLRQGPGRTASIRIEGHPVRGLVVPPGTERGHRPRQDKPRARRPRSVGRTCRRRCRTGRAGGHPPGDRSGQVRTRDSDRRPARRHLSPILRRPLRPRGGGGDGQAGGNDPRSAIPGDRRFAAPARHRGTGGGLRTVGRTRAAAEDDLMFDDVMDPNDTGLLELTRCLEAYADARLSPTAVATINIRANVMNAAHRRAALIAADVTRQVVAVPAHAADGERRRVLPRRLYRPAAAFMAASLTLALLAGTVYGAKAGGPFYGTRLWIEAANLPTSLVARAQAESVRLDTRIAEAQQASADGDAPAAEAALAAYSVIVAEAVQGTEGDSTADAAIEISIARHVVVLNQLAGTVPAHARGAIEKALASSSKAILDLNGQTPP